MVPVGSDIEEEQLTYINEGQYCKHDYEEQLYSDVSEDEDFTDCQEDFKQNCNKLEQKYIEKLHVENVESNEVYAESPVLWNLTEFEEANFHVYNVTLNRPCSAYFKTDLFMPAAGVFEAPPKDGFEP